ncbi:MAG: hypothetical protein LBE35_07055 [Clostridiales bacterium]|jgi:hypothetical protein|nr:hypothetical protein [Clostridiales bacterium]
MMLEYANIFMAGIILFVAANSGGVALWAFRRKDPMHFWAGKEVKPEEITDIAAYNRENGIMWAIFTASFVVAAVLSLFSVAAGGILVGILSTAGLVILIIVYKKIYGKYEVK